MEFTDIIRAAGALVLVLGLIGLAGLAARRWGAQGLASLGGAKSRRMAVVESLMLGARHRLFLVRTDTVEHLIVVGPQGATLVGSAAADDPAVPGTAR